MGLALEAARAHRPDVVLTDVRMPVREGFADAPGAEVSGLAAALEIRRDRPDLPILVLSQYVAAAYAAQLIDSAGRAGLGGARVAARLAGRRGVDRAAWQTATRRDSAVAHSQ